MLNMTSSNMIPFNSLDKVEEVTKMVGHYFACFNIQDISHNGLLSKIFLFVQENYRYTIYLIRKTNSRKVFL